MGVCETEDRSPVGNWGRRISRSWTPTSKKVLITKKLKIVHKRRPLLPGSN